MSKKNCKDCLFAKTRVFRDKDEFVEWVQDKTERNCASGVLRRLMKHGKARVYWCSQLHDPFIYLKSDRPLHGGEHVMCTPNYFTT